MTEDPSSWRRPGASAPSPYEARSFVSTPPRSKLSGKIEIVRQVVGSGDTVGELTSEFLVFVISGGAGEIEAVEHFDIRLGKAGRAGDPVVDQRVAIALRLFEDGLLVTVLAAADEQVLLGNGPASVPANLR